MGQFREYNRLKKYVKSMGWDMGGKIPFFNRYCKITFPTNPLPYSDFMDYASLAYSLMLSNRPFLFFKDFYKKENLMPDRKLIRHALKEKIIMKKESICLLLLDEHYKAIQSSPSELFQTIPLERARLNIQKVILKSK